MPTATSVKVVDASALAAVLFGEPEGHTVGQQLGDAQLVAPQLMHYELANVCWVKCRRHPSQRDDLLQMFTAERRLGVDSVPVDHAAALALALQTGLTAYDAAYLWLARELGAELVTLDRQLQRAAADLPLS